MNDETSTNYSGHREEDNIKNNTNNKQAILYSNRSEADWQKEFNKISNMLKLPKFQMNILEVLVIHLQIIKIQIKTKEIFQL